MDSMNELLNDSSFHKEDQLIPKTEPIDVHSIKHRRNCRLMLCLTRS